MWMILLVSVRSQVESPEPVALECPDDSSGVYLFEHTWDFDGRPRRAWNRAHVSCALENARVLESVDSYGLPLAWDWLDEGVSPRDWFRETSSSGDRPPRGLSLEERAAARGVLVSRSDAGEILQIAPDYQWLIDLGQQEVKPATDALLGAVRLRGLETTRQREDFLASFVQSIPYAIPEPIRTDRRGREIHNLGIATPIEVLYNKWGDCDSKSLLYASIMSELPNERIIFLRGNQHLFVGIRGTPRTGDHFVLHFGVPYVLAEMTSRWPVGQIPPRHVRGVRKNQFRIVDPRTMRRELGRSEGRA